MWLTLGNSTADICAVSRSPLSGWFVLDFTPYINVFITVASGNFLLSSSFFHIYLCQHQCSSHSWTVLYIFLASVWKLIFWVDQWITISTNFLILFFPFAKMSLRLVPEAVGWDASNTKRHGVLIELPFQTALQEPKFWIEFFANISCCSGVKFLTNSLCPRLWHKEFHCRGNNAVVIRL